MFKRVMNWRGHLALMLVSYLGLLWVKTAVHLMDANKDAGTLFILFISLAIVGITILYGYFGVGYMKVSDYLEGTVFYEEEFSVEKEYNPDEEKSEEESEEDSDEESDEQTRAYKRLTSSLYIVLALVGICLFSMLISQQVELLDLFNDNKNMTLFFLEFDKSYLYMIIMAIVFPLWVTFLISEVKKAEFSKKAIASVILQILVVNMLECLFYAHFSNVWALELGFVNILSLIIAVKSYAWEYVESKGDCLALLILYVFFWGFLLIVTRGFEHSIIALFATDSTRFDSSLSYSYITNVKKIISNASLIGSCSNLTSDPYVLEFLGDEGRIFMSVLFFWGWIPAIALLLLEFVFAFSAAALVFRNIKKDGFDVMYSVVWLTLAIRVLVGSLYSFGIPVPINLPFGGTVGIYECSISVGLILLCWLEPKIDDGLSIYDFDEEDEEDDGKDDEESFNEESNEDILE